MPGKARLKQVGEQKSLFTGESQNSRTLGVLSFLDIPTSLQSAPREWSYSLQGMWSSIASRFPSSQKTPLEPLARSPSYGIIQRSDCHIASFDRVRGWEGLQATPRMIGATCRETRALWSRELQSGKIPRRLSVAWHTHRWAADLAMAPLRLYTRRGCALLGQPPASAGHNGACGARATLCLPLEPHERPGYRI